MEKEGESPGHVLSHKADCADPSAGPIDQAPELAAPSFRSVMVLLGRQLGRNLAGLVVPVGVITVSLVTLCGTIAMLALRDHVLIVNDRLELLEPSWWPAVTVTVMALAVVAAHLAMVAMVAVMVAGSLLGRPVSAGRSLRRVMRRADALLVLFVVFVVAAAAVLAVAGFVAAASESVWAGVIVACPFVLMLWRLPLAVPIVMLEGVGPFRALARTWGVTWDKRARMFGHLMVTVVVLPVVLGASASWMVSLVSGIGHDAAQVVSATVLGVLTAIVQGAGLAVVALNQWRPPKPLSPLEPLDVTAVATRLRARGPSPRPRRVRALLLMALTLPALVAPGFLYGGYLRVNPHQLPAISEETLPGFPSDGHMLLDDGSLMVQESREEARLCPDRECTRTRATPSVPVNLRLEARAVAPLPDGSLAFAQWELDDHGKEDELKLRRCTARGCTASDEAPTIAKNSPSSGFDMVTLAASGQDLLVATTSFTRDPGIPQKLRLLRCTGVLCDKLRTLAVVEIPKAGHPGVEPIAVATGARGRPVVTYEDSATGAITLLSCADPDCSDSVKRHPVAGDPLVRSGDTDRPDRSHWSGGVELVVPPDDHPVLVHRDVKTGASRLLRCRTPDCSTADAVTLTDPIPTDMADLALGLDGLPLVATFDMRRRQTVLITCNVPDCSRRGTVNLGTFPAGFYPGVLDLAVGRDGRPLVLWEQMVAAEGRIPPFRTSLRLLTCRDARCGG